jgi:hypothetical protein
MEMEEKIKICKICQNKSYTSEKGIVCGLTNEKPDFEKECPDFKIDQLAISNQLQGQGQGQGQKQSDEELETGFKVLSFCVPIAGLILYFMNKDKFPKKASQACSMAIWGFVVGIVLNIIVYAIAFAVGDL